MRDIIARVKDKKGVGVCVDTCHVFGPRLWSVPLWCRVFGPSPCESLTSTAAGYDIRTPDKLAAFLASFDRIVGAQYLRGWHFNDSKPRLQDALGSHKDRSADPGRVCCWVKQCGFVGLFVCVSVCVRVCVCGLRQANNKAGAEGMAALD